MSAARRSRFFPNRALFFEWLRFVVVGCINTAVGYGLYAFCIWLGANYLAAIAVSTIGGVIFNYGTTGAIVFARRDGSFVRFIACYVVVFAVSVLLIKFQNALGVNPYLSGLIAAFPAALISFILLRTYVFRVGRKA